MTTLIIIVALIAIAYIFGKDVAKFIIVGSGTLVVLGVVVVLMGAAAVYFWDTIQNNQAAQKVLGYFAIALVFAVLSIIKEKYDQRHEEKEGKVEVVFVPKYENKESEK